MKMKLKKNFVQVCLIVVFMAAGLFVWQRDCGAEIYLCNTNPDYFTKKCTVHPDAITNVINGTLVKGHLVGCQYKSFSCIKVDGKGECRDSFGTAIIPFEFPMSDFTKLCHLLCTNPSCSGSWE